jgi:hypothetical protein
LLTRAPGLKFGFTGSHVAISFGQYTSPGVLIAYRVGGQDWTLTNVTANSTHSLITPSTPGLDWTLQSQLPNTFELRVTNWAYGVQISAVHLEKNAQLIKLKNYSKRIEVIGDSLSSGYTNTYEGISSWAWGVGAGLGNVEFSITAYPGICLVDQNCWGNPRGQTFQWFHTQDTSPRAYAIWGNSPEEWDFTREQTADIVIINIGTNDNNTHNNVSTSDYYNSYIDFVGKVHKVWPDADIVLHSLWNGFGAIGNSYYEVGAFKEEIYNVYLHYKNEGFVYYFNTTGIMQHNDIVSTSFGASGRL